MSPIDKISDIRRWRLAQAEVIEETPPEDEEKPSEVAEPAEEGFQIDLIGLKEALSEIKWSDDTAKTFMASEYKVSPPGTLEDVLKRLTQEQAEEFIKEIQERVDKKQLELFE